MLTPAAVRTLIAERPGVSLRDLALHFRVSEGMMEMFLERLAARGDVETVLAPASCCSGGCTGCGSADACGGKGYKLSMKAIRAMRAAEASEALRKSLS